MKQKEYKTQDIYPYLSTHNTQSEIDYFEQFRHKTFEEFWSLLPNKLNYLKYEEELAKILTTNKYVRVKKATGLGISEFFLRWVAWMCLNNDDLKNKQVDVTCILVTGPRLELAIQLIDRLKALFDYQFDTKNTVCVLNGCKIEAFPSHHLASARGLSPKIVLLDEADFFPIGQQQEARSIAERYIPKSDPWLVLVSTPYNPGGLYDTMDQEDTLYHLLEWNYEVGLKAGIFTQTQIEIAQKSPSFEREYNLQYGVGVGNLYPASLIDDLIEKYDLTYKDGEKVRCIDPAYGSSKFAISEWERLDGIMYCKYCIQLDRPSPTAITQHIVERDRLIPMQTLVDSAHPGLIRDLIDRNVQAREVKFNQTLSNMTIEGTQTVKEKRVRFHPDICRPLIQQLKAVESNDKGHPDKTKLNFDLGDTYQMAADHLKISNVSLTVVNPYIDDE